MLRLITQIIYAATIIFCIVTTTKAQDKPNSEKSEDNFKGLVSFSAGASVPLSEFGNKDLSNENSGLAKTGLSYQLNLSYVLGSDIGIGAKAFYFYNPQDANVWLTGFLSNAAITEYYKITTHPWEFKGVTGGLYYTFELEQSFADVKVMVGFADVTFPSLMVNVSNGSDTLDFGLNATHKMVPVFEIDFGLRLAIKKRVDFLVNFDYMVTSTQFEVFDSFKTFQYSQNTRVAVINISLGLGYKF